MDKVVKCLDYGELPIVHNNIQDVVFFIIFELADGDVRTQIDVSKRYDNVWSLHALHNLATAIKQLHTADITHNDIKPSNVLTFGEHLQKLADLGRATSGSISGPFDVLPCPGQISYAAPEQLYNVYHETSIIEVPFNYRKSSDLYLLGSMLYFFTTGQMLTPMILNFLRAEHNPTNWGGTFKDILPYWRDAFGSALHVFERCLEKDENDILTEISQKQLEALKQLAEPDPNLRGHPSSMQQNANRFSVERYISLFDLLRNKAQVRL